MKKFKTFFILIIVVMGLFTFPAAASNLMDANLYASFHYIPILQDSAEAYTFYGTGAYCKTAAAQVEVKAYKSDGSYNSSGVITRYGWDAVSGEGTSGICSGTAKIRAMSKAISTHKGNTTGSSTNWTEITTLKITK